MEAAIAAITGQPLTAVSRASKQCLKDLTGLACPSSRLLPEDVSHATLSRLGFRSHKFYACVEPLPMLGDVLRAYMMDPGRVKWLLVVSETDDVFAFVGNEVANWRNAAPIHRDAAIKAGFLDLCMPVRFAVTVVAHRPTAIQPPDHAFLATLALPALGLAEAYEIKVDALDHPYWCVTFPEQLMTESARSRLQIVCGEHELLRVLCERVKSLETAIHAAAELIGRSRGSAKALG